MPVLNNSNNIDLPYSQLNDINGIQINIIYVGGKTMPTVCCIMLIRLQDNVIIVIAQLNERRKCRIERPK